MPFLKICRFCFAEFYAYFTKHWQKRRFLSTLPTESLSGNASVWSKVWSKTSQNCMLDGNYLLHKNFDMPNLILGLILGIFVYCI